MPKRKQEKSREDEEEEEGSETDTQNRIQVDFEFFDPNPDIDFVALKRLITQLFQSDADLLKPHDLAELILSQPLVGTTVKTDGRESDPYAFLTVLNMHIHKDNPAIKAIAQYALSKSTADPSLHNTLRSILESETSSHLGFIFSERLVNMPVEVIPHMYRMLADEIQWACDDSEPYHFSHFLVLSRTYTLSDEEAEAGLSFPQQPKRRKGAPTPSNAGGIFTFHHEDQCIQQVASHSLNYSLSNALPRENESFGLEQGGRLMLFPAVELPQLVLNLMATFPQPSQ
ncbi:p21-C-terminal region-binding protein-domain-containing protein [Multifurca ochricompacta]|uniref:Protein BCP1 n=1 Tax=Multifurca ochricompacta TaxID=376703 RepID=A0AAD4MBN1_9AGAM|nr:p21-C-terminal region-binding protein-domain-containing protein [Multifurca ochricompacta]